MDTLSTALIDDRDCMKFNYEERSDFGTITGDVCELFDKITENIDIW
jgi:hypothetical protein